MSYRPISDMWFLARAKYKDGSKRYGGYLGGFPERARALLGVSIEDPVLHVCGGLAKQYPYRGGFGPHDATLDLDPSVKPDYLQDARVAYPKGFKAILADPPYSLEDSKQYVPGPMQYPTPNAILRNSLEALEVGQRVGLIHYQLPQPGKLAKFVACVGIISGFNNRIRCFSVFEKL